MIGKPYFAKAWYATRGNRLAPAKKRLFRRNWIGIYGRARRHARPYRDNVHPYNWHWFRIMALAKRSTMALTK